MIGSAFFAAESPASAPVSEDHRPGACNIGPAEIARRRRAGHLGLAATLLVLVALVLLDAPPITRLVLALPAAAAAAGYLQAWLKFCVAFGARGIFNFGPLGRSEEVVDVAARAKDRARASQIGLASLAVGALVGIAAVLLPL
jgi:hypothetical protein